MKHILFSLMLFTLAAPLAGQGSYLKVWPVDTLTNAENDTLLLPVAFKDENAFFWQINAVQLSGTSAAVARVQVSLDNSNWINTGDTLAIAGSTAGKILGTSFAPRMRVIIYQTGTSSTKYNVAAMIRKRLF